jgi:hypothetical protein
MGRLREPILMISWPACHNLFRCRNRDLPLSHKATLAEAMLGISPTHSPPERSRDGRLVRTRTGHLGSKDYQLSAPQNVNQTHQIISQSGALAAAQSDIEQAATVAAVPATAFSFSRNTERLGNFGGLTGSPKLRTLGSALLGQIDCGTNNSVSDSPVLTVQLLYQS